MPASCAGGFSLESAPRLATPTVATLPCTPHPGVHRLTGAFALGYLILQSVVPLLPGFFMTWADYALYKTYDLAPRAIAGFDAVNDQQTAAAILQVGGMVFLWAQIAFRFLHWGYQEMELDRQPRKPIAESRASTS